MPIMKLPIANGQTAWIPFPHTVYSIIDDTQGGSTILMESNPGTAARYTIKGHDARATKRSIQENTDEHIGFLKLSIGTTTRKMYVNTFYIESLESISATKARIHLRNSGGVGDDAGEHALYVTADPAQLAFQLRRIVKRLDQDEEFCCDAPAEEEEAE